ncbi:MAG: hypothetical protein J5I98_16375 [Phaeodactylibacter sp.]|nr:hypothetical protein [Phaeodactylibacter sp.]
MRKTIVIFLLLQCLSFFSTDAQEYIFIKPDDQRIAYTGRVLLKSPDEACIGWPGVQISLAFEADTLFAHFGDLRQDSLRGAFTTNYYNVFLDDSLHSIVNISGLDTIFCFTGWNKGPHRITFFKRTEGLFGTDAFLGFQLSASGRVFSPEKNKPWIEFIGNSITAGYGNEGESQHCRFSAETENHYLSYAALAARELGYAHTAICWSGRGILWNYDGSSDGTLFSLWEQALPLDTALKWPFAGPAPEAVVANLGTNDFAKGIPDSTAFVNRYVAFLQKIRENYPEADIFCINGPMLQDEKREKLGAFLQAISLNFGRQSKSIRYKSYKLIDNVLK